jgi:flagellin-like hook-associated protein FlgL
LSLGPRTLADLLGSGLQQKTLQEVRQMSSYLTAVRDKQITDDRSKALTEELAAVRTELGALTEEFQILSRYVETRNTEADKALGDLQAKVNHLIKERGERGTLTLPSQLVGGGV